MVSVVATKRSSRIYQGVVDVSTPGGTLSVDAASVQPGALQNLLRRPTTLATLSFLRVELVKGTPMGAGLGKPIVAATAVGSTTRLDVTWDDPGAVPEQWFVRIEHIHSVVR